MDLTRPSFLLAAAVTAGVALGQPPAPMLLPAHTQEVSAERDRLRARSGAAVGAYAGKHRRHLRPLYRARDATLLREHARGTFLHNPYWGVYLDGLLARIRAASPADVAADTRAYVRRSGAVNASCYGEGTASVDLGMIARLRSDDEVAFVLCHELAHQRLAHVDAQLRAHVDRLYDASTQRELARLCAGRGEADERAAFLREFAFDGAAHSRFGELAADSLGLVLYRRAGFAPAAPARVMRVLAAADTAAYASALDLPRLLSTPGYAFAPAAFAEPAEKFATVAALSAEDREALRTHPDVERRAARLVGLPAKPASRTTAVATVPETPAATAAFAATAATSAFVERRRAARRETVAADFAYGDVAAALYGALRLTGDTADADREWARAVAALSLYRIDVARRGRRMSEIVRLPRHRTSDEGFESLLRGLHSLRGSEVTALAEGYAREYAPDLATAPPEWLLLLALRADAPAEDRDIGRLARERLRGHPYDALLTDGRPDPWMPLD